MNGCYISDYFHHEQSMLRELLRNLERKGDKKGDRGIMHRKITVVILAANVVKSGEFEICACQTLKFKVEALYKDRIYFL